MHREFVSYFNQSDLSDLTLSMHRVTGSPWIADFRRWTILFCSSAGWLSENKLSVLCNSPKGCVLWSEWLIHVFHLWKQDVNSSNVCKYKHKILKHLATRCLAGSLVKTLFSQEIFVGDLKLNSKCRQQFKFFPGKYFVQYKLINWLKTRLPPWNQHRRGYDMR